MVKQPVIEPSEFQMSNEDFPALPGQTISAPLAVSTNVGSSETNPPATPSQTGNYVDVTSTQVRLFNIGFCEEQWLGYFNCCPVVSVLTFFFDDLMSYKPFYAEICLFKNKNRCVLPILKHCIVISLNGKQINNKRINETV